MPNDHGEGQCQFSHWPLLRQLAQGADICCRDILSTALLSLNLCAASPLILQLCSDIVVLVLLTLDITVPFCLYVLMLNTWVTIWHENVVLDLFLPLLMSGGCRLAVDWCLHWSLSCRSTSEQQSVSKDSAAGQYTKTAQTTTITRVLCRWLWGIVRR